MTPAEFEQALERWGADLDRWPPAAATEARACLAASPEARRALAAAHAVDAHLAGWRRHAAPPHLAARIGAAAPANDAVERLLGWLTARPWRPALLSLLLLAGGYLAGQSAGEPLDRELADAVVTLAFGDLYGELENAD